MSDPWRQISELVCALLEIFHWRQWQAFCNMWGQSLKHELRRYGLQIWMILYRYGDRLTMDILKRIMAKYRINFYRLALEWQGTFLFQFIIRFISRCQRSSDLTLPRFKWNFHIKSVFAIDWILEISKRQDLRKFRRIVIRDGNWHGDFLSASV